MSKNTPARRSPRSRSSSRSRKRKSSPRIGMIFILSLAGFVVLLLTGAGLARHFAPLSNTARQHFDVILVLGYPTDADGNPSPAELTRVTEGVREYERGVAPRIIFSGAAAHNQFVEAEAMARVARSMGVPDSAILVEPRALDTIQNARYSVEIMQQHGWNSVEIVSHAAHLPRAALIFDRLPVEWRVHAAPSLQQNSAVWDAAGTIVEIVKTARFLCWTRWIEPWQP